MKIFFFASFLYLVLLLVLSQHAKGLTFKHLGCFKDNWFSRALPEYLGTFRNPSTSSKQCANLVMKKGYTTFAIQSGGQCWSGVSAEHTYNRYGKAKGCRGGVGGAYANDVYQFPLYLLLKKIRSKFTKQALLIKALSRKDKSLTRSLYSLKNRISRSRVWCYYKYTKWDLYAAASILYLDRQFVSCPYPYFLSNFRLQGRGGGSRAPVRYRYRCCKFIL